MVRRRPTPSVIGIHPSGTPSRAGFNPPTSKVNWLNGNYNAGTLNLTDRGDPLHRFTLQAVNLYGPILSTTGKTIILLQWPGTSLSGPDKLHNRAVIYGVEI